MPFTTRCRCPYFTVQTSVPLGLLYKLKLKAPLSAPVILACIYTCMTGPRAQDVDLEVQRAPEANRFESEPYTVSS